MIEATPYISWGLKGCLNLFSSDPPEASRIREGFRKIKIETFKILIKRFIAVCSWRGVG